MYCTFNFSSYWSLSLQTLLSIFELSLVLTWSINMNLDKKKKFHRSPIYFNILLASCNKHEHCETYVGVGTILGIYALKMLMLILLWYFIRKTNGSYHLSHLRILWQILNGMTRFRFVAQTLFWHGVFCALFCLDACQIPKQIKAMWALRSIEKLTMMNSGK